MINKQNALKNIKFLREDLKNYFNPINKITLELMRKELYQ